MMKRVRVKICGVTRADDGVAAARVGADAIGLVFYPHSARAVSPERAREIGRALPPFVARVALFLDADADAVARVVDTVHPDILQFHGREAPAFCRAFDRPYIKAVPMGDDDIDVAAYGRDYTDAQGLLLDANRAGQAGGCGKRFDWYDGDLPDADLVIAGGLDAANVSDAIRRYAPYAVDVSSGVESAPGIKDARRMREFMHAVFTTAG